MLIIFEGPNGVGKSTIISQLAESGAELIVTPRKIGACSEIDWEFEQRLYELPAGRTFLLDRHTPSSIAYNALRGTLTGADLVAIRHAIKQLDAKQAVLYAQFKSEHTGPFDNGRTKLDGEAYARLVEIYDAVYEWLPFKHKAVLAYRQNVNV